MSIVHEAQEAQETKKTTIFNLEDFQVSETADIPIYDAAGSKMGDATITVYGPGSDEFAQASAQWIRRDKKIDRGDSQAILESNAKFLADCTVRFNSLGYQGKTGRSLHIAVYENPRLGFIAEQVLKQVRDWGNYSQDGEGS